MSGRLSVTLVLLVSALLVTLGVMSFKENNARTRPAVIPFDLFSCEKDEDCAVAKQISCCPCKQGGGQAAVAAAHRDDLRRFLKHACRKEQVCVQVNVCQYSMQARCVNGQCKLVHADG